MASVYGNIGRRRMDSEQGSDSRVREGRAKCGCSHAQAKGLRGSNLALHSSCIKKIIIIIIISGFRVCVEMDPVRWMFRHRLQCRCT